MKKKLSIGFVLVVVMLLVALSPVFAVPPTEVDVDIDPGSCPNPLNVKSKGVLSVAIVGTEDFDVTDIDPASVRLEGIVAPLRWAYEDVATPYDGGDCDCHELGFDGYNDLTLKFSTQEIVAALGGSPPAGSSPLTLTGALTSGPSIEGQDCVLIINR